MLSCDSVGMGAFREMNKNGDMEIKRMYIPIKYRGKGFSKMILKELKKWAKEEKLHLVETRNRVQRCNSNFIVH